MKYLRLAWLCLLCVPPTNVCAQVGNGVDILSSAYLVSGTWSYTWIELNTNTLTWEPYSSGSGNYGGSSSDGSPLSGQLTTAGYSFPPGLAFAGVSGDFSIDMFDFRSDTVSGAPNTWQGSDGNTYKLASQVDAQPHARCTLRP